MLWNMLKEIYPNFSQQLNFSVWRNWPTHLDCCCFSVDWHPSWDHLLQVGLQPLTNYPPINRLLLRFPFKQHFHFLSFSGWLCDTTKNYTASFFTGGAMLMMCAIMHMMAPCVLNLQARWEKRKRGPTVPIPDTQPQIVQGEIIIMEKGYNPEL